MDFIDEVRTRSRRFQGRPEHLGTEEATKHSLVMPFMEMMGYNIYDPTEVVPEFTVDFGNKKGEKVDYALVINGTPVILIEAKKYGTNLRVEDESQLFRYFQATSARFGILTDGIDYRFYSDLDEAGKMDQRAFFEFNMLDFKDDQVGQLKQFHRETFDTTKALEVARELKYTNEVIRVLTEEMRNSSDDFVRFILTRIEYPGLKTKRLIDQFTSLVQQAFAQFVKDLIDTRLKSALDRGEEREDEPAEDDTDERSDDVEYPLHLFLNSKGVRARARYDGKDNFVVLSGSQVVKDETRHLSEKIAAMRKALLDDGTLADHGVTYEMTTDQTFKTPSGAGSFILANSVSGPRVWRGAEGRQLRDLA